jgi:hypothetical protein
MRSSSVRCDQIGTTDGRLDGQLFVFVHVLPEFCCPHEDHAIFPIEILDAHAVEFPLVSDPGIPHQDHDVTKEFMRSLTPLAGRSSR